MKKQQLLGSKTICLLGLQYIQDRLFKSRCRGLYTFFRLHKNIIKSIAVAVVKTSTQKTSGIGFRNIRGRLSVFNGEANVITSLGKGFALEIMIPL